MSGYPFKRGQSREQVSFLPARIEDYVGVDNPVRAIDAYVDTLDMVELGFHNSRHRGRAGQPPYDPADLLKLYLYGYLHRVRSSRRLERETRRNLELIWLLRGLAPGYRTIATFRSENAAALKRTNREFVLLLGSLDLLGGEVVAIDGAFFDGNASKASIVTPTQLAKRIAAIDRDIEAHHVETAANDAAEAAASEALGNSGSSGKSGNGKSSNGGSGGDAAGRMAALLARRAACEADLAALEKSGETQLSRTDADARLLSKNGQTVAGYNVQIAVDGKHKLIVAGAVVNDGNDTGQLHAMAVAAKKALDQEALAVVADAGYFNGETLKACETDGIVAFVPEPERGRPPADGRFGQDAFVYDAAADAYRCPAGESLAPQQGGRPDASGKWRIRYVSRISVCKACPLRPQCLGAKTNRRSIERWEHAAVVERHRARMTTTEAKERIRQRKALAEHPFGTLKCRAGYRHFLLRGFDKVRGEWSLMMLGYNFTRLLSIIGLNGFIARLAA